MIDQYGKIYSKNNVCVALLEDVQMVEYNGCSSEYNTDFYKPELGWTFIGKGVIYSVNGVRQAMEETKYFFVKDKVEDEPI